MEKDYLFSQDCRLIQELLELDLDSFSQELQVSRNTLENWEWGKTLPSPLLMERLYSYAEQKGIRLNEIKSQFHEEGITPPSVLLFHGSKNGILGPLSIAFSQRFLDFGPAFYCGESMEQSASFVAEKENSSLYFLSFDPTSLHGERFVVNQEWMWAVAFYRGKLKGYEELPLLKPIREKVDRADFLIAPIADNRMFTTIDSYIGGLITDEQCLHSLSATDLGFQYIFRNEKALDQVHILEHAFLCSEEKRRLLMAKAERNLLGDQKAHAALISYRGQGHYIDEVFHERD